MAFLSVIVVAHNAAHTLDATFESLQLAMGEARSDIEIVIFNDGSDDSTQDIIERWLMKLPNAIAKNVNYRNVGQVRNSAVAMASGEYITMLDSDDLLKPNSLSDAITFLKAQRPDMLLTRLLEIRDVRKINPEWGGLILFHCHVKMPYFAFYSTKISRLILSDNLFCAVFTKAIPSHR